jgi:hypothetical protein
MAIFARTFPFHRLNQQVLEGNPWFADMLRYWRPAGDVLYRELSHPENPVLGVTLAEKQPVLRLAIRDGYLNLYKGGQSLARIRFGRDGSLLAQIHNKYIYGNEGSGQTYVTLRSDGYLDPTGRLLEYGGPADLDRWIANASRYVHDEKRFVDAVVARNPNAIDLEMALPAYSVEPGERVAPRMDLIVLEPAGDRWRVVFWEAKLVRDRRARCRGDEVLPEVVRQLERYTSWLRYGNHRELVAASYQNACRLLVAFHTLAMQVNPEIEALGSGIVTAAAAEALPLLIDDEPRLLIDDRRLDPAFTRNGHLDKLRRHGLHVQMVQSAEQMVLDLQH